MKKAFDCVEMKRKIQEDQIKRLQGLSAEEELRLMRETILQDPLLAKIWNTSRRTRNRTQEFEN